MKKPSLKDIFSFRAPLGFWWGILTPFTETDLEKMLEEDKSESLSEGPLKTAAQPLDERWQKIRFDNTIRMWISTLTYILCLGLWLGGVIPSAWPVTALFILYGSLQFSCTWFFMGRSFSRIIDFVLCTTDLVIMSVAVCVTGGFNSPIYLCYFIPIIIQAFHRDWALFLYNGFGGIFFYAVAILAFVLDRSTAQIVDLVVRLVFMVMSVSTAVLAVNILRKKESVEQKRLFRLRTLMLVANKLNRLHIETEVGETIQDIVKLLNSELKKHTPAWLRIFIAEDNGLLMQAVEDPAGRRLDLKQELTVSSCPAVKTQSPFFLKDAKNEPACPTESFEFGSHLCIPISGTENESFGVLFAGSSMPNAFEEEDIRLFQFIARSLGLSMQRVKRMEELRKAMEMDSCATATFMASTRDMNDTTASIMEGVQNLLKADQVSLMFFDPGTGTLKTAYARGDYSHLEMKLAFSVGQGIPGRVLETGEPYWTADVRQDPLYKDTAIPIRAMVCLPLRNIKGEVVGVANAYRTQTAHPFSAFEIDLALTFATRATLAIENARLHEEERKAPLPASDQEIKKAA